VFEVKVEFSFLATHALTMPGGDLEQPHSHQWVIDVHFEGDSLDDSGMLLDFDKARTRLKEIITPLEGGDLNKSPFLQGRPSSSENLARRIFELLNQDDWGVGLLKYVEVHEAPGCRAGYRP